MGTHGMRGIHTAKRNATALDSWRSSLEAMSLDELDGLLTDEERSLWFAAIAGRRPDDRIPVGELLTSDLVAVLAEVLAQTRACA